MSESQQNFTIKEWSEEDRPREKLLLKGKESLSDAELLAILIGSGSRSESAVDLCRRILKDNHQKLNALAKLSIADLIRNYKGIGEAKAISIQASLELGRRRRMEEALVTPKITSSSSVYEIFHPLTGDLNHEEFWVLFLNNSNLVLGKYKTSSGGMTGTVVDIRLIYKKALEVGAVGIVLAHNHPSGTLRPSDADLSITKRIKAAGETLDIKVLDHLIVTQHAYYSFADEGMLE